MAREDPVEEFKWPKARIGAAITGLIFTALGVILDKVFKSVLETALSLIAGASIILMIMALFAFVGAWEQRESSHEKKIDMMNFQMKELNEDFNIKCLSCSFNHQSLLVGLSAKHTNELQEQREFYEDYITAVIYVLDTAIIRTVKAEGSILPIVEGLAQSPLYKEYKNNKELRKWKTFINLVRDDVR